jgi:hypothetical protein
VSVGGATAREKAGWSPVRFNNEAEPKLKRGTRDKINAAFEILMVAQVECKEKVNPARIF